MAWKREIFLFFVYSKLFSTSKPCQINFYKRILLHVIPVYILVHGVVTIKFSKLLFLDFRAYIVYFLYFTKEKKFKNYEKHLLLHLKCCFHSQNIQFIAIFPFLFTVSRFKRSDKTGIIMTL